MDGGSRRRSAARLPLQSRRHIVRRVRLIGQVLPWSQITVKMPRTVRATAMGASILRRNNAAPLRPLLNWIERP